MSSTVPFTERVIQIIKKIPKGSVITYGQAAAWAGNSRAARQVAYILHSSSEKHGLPWHRVINGKGMIALRKGRGAELQKQLLLAEGIDIDNSGRIDLKVFSWL
ncbi:DNA methyltransferase [candidate division WOR-3 bacterium RBG_13_43_14]|uniref:DNA methyltransferase n=1 Tax=candidate division WOR-3 bacterium RBG_13_43_14 TaxID=1802590 RepID=A0A1F4UAC7_UNCW3|nr:MAG: DNA methyltransferase [candidate division WOR-3 bacterium RBG_13_43_14]